MDRFNPIAKGEVGDGSFGWLALEPRLVAALRHIVNTVEHRDAVIGLMSFH